MGAICCHGNQSSNPISPKNLMQSFACLMMLRCRMAGITESAMVRPNRIKDWLGNHERAFQTLKSRLTSSPILRLPVFNEGKPFILRSDASDIGIGAVLLQEFEGEGKLPIAYASKKLLPRERNYSVIEKECLAIIWAIEKFRKYLFVEEFILECDHKPLSFMQTAKALNPRIMRWALKLQPYRFRIVAIRGQDNVGADYLSR